MGRKGRRQRVRLNVPLTPSAEDPLAHARVRQSPLSGSGLWAAQPWCHAQGVDDIALVEQVHELVALVLSEASFGGQEQLVAQVPHLRIGGGRITFLRLLVDRSLAPRSSFERGPVPGSTWVFGDDESPIGTLLVWVDDGYISALEYAWVTDNAPGRLPDVNQIRLGGP